MNPSAQHAGLPLFRSAQVRAIDSAIIASGTSGHELMRRAAQAAFDRLRLRWPHARRIAVVCGPGNNGGDGYVLARLARDAGMAVQVIATAPPRSEEALRALQAWQAGGGGIEPPGTGLELAGRDVVVDALFGIGFARAPQGAEAQLIDAMNASTRPVLALDVPSGLDADRGSTAGVCVRATCTVSFIAAKCGLYTGRAREFCGEIELADLEVAASQLATQTPVARLHAPDDLSACLPRRARDAHKGAHGHVLAVGGDRGYAGAIRLCAEAALRSGAGLVSVATRAEHTSGLVISRPELMAHAVEDATALLALTKRADVLALGPGLGQGAWGIEMLAAAHDLTVPMVMDADALNLLARAPRAVPHAVLTPHPGEAARLLGTDVAAIEGDRFHSAQAVAERYQAVTVLKGAGSIVAAPGRVPAVIGAGNPGMASGGMGDVLTGVIAALLAQGLTAFEAARVGALLHAAAGDTAAASMGERGLLASDLFPCLHQLANPV